MMRLCVVLLLLMVTLQGAAEQAPSRSTFAKLMDVQELWEDNRYPEAIAKLEALAEATRGKPYDFAVTNQYLAHTAVMMGEHERARPALEAALAVPGLPAKLIAELKMFYAQIVIGDEEYELARKMFDDWLAVTEETPSPAQLFSVGYANYMSGHLAESRDFVSQAINQSPEPPDGWLRLYYEILFDSKAFDDARQISINLLNRDLANEGYWRLLANHHMRLEEYAEALSIAEVAMHTGAMQDETDLRRMTTLYRQVLVPEKAARRLATWMEAGNVEETAVTWRQLGDMWLLAREYDNAKSALWKSVSMEADAETLEFLAGLHFEDAEWQQSFEAFERTLRVTDSDDENLHRLEMLTGLTAMRAGHEGDARKYLMMAQQDSKLRGQVRAILRELERD
jgi:tetratricopeptide (TPR) repeat protein